jgi:transmembrane sensor
MEANEEHIDELIAKYLAGEALPDEAIWLDDWKNQSEANSLYFNRSKKALQFTLDEHIDTDKLFQRITQQQQTRPVYKLNRYFTPFNIAAAIVFVSLLGFITSIIFKGNSEPDILFTSAETVKQQTLSDGSTVALNKQSTLTVMHDFNTKQRKVKLEGEAFFDIKHNEEISFVIEAGNLLIKDIGTAFNVKAEAKSDSISVFVTEGIVELSANNQLLILHQNEGAIYLKSSGNFIESQKLQPNIAAYKTKQFHFKGNTLGEVTETLNAVYGQLIQLENEQLRLCTISVDFQNESPEMIVAIIAETLGLTVEQKNGTYFLRGKGCNL